jgi:putative hydrolase of the HAD superfamily
LPVESKLHKDYKPVILTYKIGVLMGDKKIYKEAIKRLNVQPNRCLYIDYKERNLEVARRLGINTLLYKGYPQLIRNLKKIGVNWVRPEEREI